MIAGCDGEADGVDVYVSKRIALPVPAAAVCPGFGRAACCFSLHRVSWRETRLRGRDQLLVYRFRAPDAEAVRQVLRKADIDFDDLWVCRDSGQDGGPAVSPAAMRNTPPGG